MSTLLAGGVAFLVLILFSLEDLQSDWGSARPHNDQVAHTIGFWTLLLSTAAYAAALFLMRHGSRRAVFAAMTLAAMLCLAVPVWMQIESAASAICGCEMR